MVITKTKIISGLLIVLAVFSGLIIEWQFDKDWISLRNNDTIIAKERWVVEAERSWFALDSWYDKNVKCPKILDKGGHISPMGTRCYYPDDYYEQMSRSLINTKIFQENKSTGFDIVKQTPFYQYGTRGSYAGYVTETMFFVDPTLSEKEFPLDYEVNWKPRDTRNYRLIWRIENLKQINLPDGEYHQCSYEFGNVLIDISNDCDKLDKAIISSQSKIYFYFKPMKGLQELSPILVDPIYEPNIELNITLTNLFEYNNWSEWINVTYWNQTCIWNATNVSWAPCLYNVSKQINHSILVKEWQTLTAENDTYSKTMNVTYWCGGTTVWDDDIDRIWGKSWLDGGGKSIELISGRSYFWINYTTDQPTISNPKDYYGECYLMNLKELISE